MPDPVFVYVVHPTTGAVGQVPVSALNLWLAKGYEQVEQPEQALTQFKAQILAAVEELIANATGSAAAASAAAETAAAAATTAATAAGLAALIGDTNSTLMAYIDADAESTFRVQQDARLAAMYAAVLVDVAGVYPARPPTAEVVLFVGTTDPAAFMEEQDLWINVEAAPPLDEAAAVALLESGDSDLYDAVGEAAIAQTLATRWMNPENFISVSGAPSLLYVGTTAYSRTRAWLLDAVAVEVVSGIFTVPPGWSEMSVTLSWANQGAGAGDVRWRTGYFHLAEDGNSDVADTFMSDNVVTAAAASVLKRSTIPGSIAVTAGERVRISVTRQANDATDTLANDVGLTGVLLTRLA